MNTEKFLRLFVGIPLPKYITDPITSFVKRYDRFHGIRWVPPENLHITTLFIGKVKEDQVEYLTKDFQKSLTSVSPFSLELEALKYAPNPRKPRMIWAKFKEAR